MSVIPSFRVLTCVRRQDGISCNGSFTAMLIRPKQTRRRPINKARDITTTISQRSCTTTKSYPTKISGGLTVSCHFLICLNVLYRNGRADRIVADSVHILVYQPLHEITNLCNLKLIIHHVSQEKWRVVILFSSPPKTINKRSDKKGPHPVKLICSGERKFHTRPTILKTNCMGEFGFHGMSWLSS